MSKVLFATKCYAKDWHKFLRGDFQLKVDSIGYPFDGKVLMLNNGVPEDAVLPLTEACGFTLDVEAMLPYLYEHFGVTDTHFNGGKWYAVAEMGAALFAAKEGYDYLCYVQGDCVTMNGDWVTQAIRTLEREPDVLLVSPRSDVNTWHDKHGYDHYCSDQAFVARAGELATPEVYHIEGTDPDYPNYGGNSFEAMVGKYLKATGKKRKIYENFWTIHG